MVDMGAWLDLTAKSLRCVRSTSGIPPTKKFPIITRKKPEKLKTQKSRQSPVISPGVSLSTNQQGDMLSLVAKVFFSV